MSDPEAVRAHWRAVDYPAVARRLRPAAEALVEAVGPLRGLEVLDVATGTGTAALLAARAGARAVGVDLTTELLEIARAAAADEGLEASFLEGDAEALEFEELRFDRVLSTFGVVFAPDPAIAAGELARVCTVGGVIALTTWPPDGVPAAMGRIAAAHLADGRTARRQAGAAAWGSESGLHGLFEGRGVQLRVQRREDLVWRFEDAEAAVDLVQRGLPALHAALPAIERAGRGAAFRADLAAMFAEHGRREAGGLAIPFDYLLVTGAKTG